jgi:hypothetical protein
VGLDMNNDRSVPAVLWIAMVALAAMTLIHIVLGFSRPKFFLAAILDSVILVGLYRGHKWAYFLTAVFCVLGAGVALLKSLGNGLGVLLLNGLALVPVIVSTSYFFPCTVRNIQDPPR